MTQVEIMNAGNARYRPQALISEISCGKFYSGVDVRRGGEVTLFYPMLKTQQSARSVSKLIGAILNQNRPLRDTPYCTIRDFGLDQQEQLFLVYDRPQGAPLYTFLRAQKSLDLDLSLSLMIQLCELLRRAHDLQIFTASITPYNMIIDRSSDGVARLSLIDLGLDRRPLVDAVVAPPIELSSPPPAELTQERDRRHFVVYLCSALLHQLIFGVKPAAPVTSYDRVWPTLPSKGRRLDRRLEACLHTVLLKGLAANPQARFPRISAFQRTLIGLRQLVTLSSPAFELLSSTQRRLGNQAPQLNLSAPKKGVERAVKARQRIHKILEGGDSSITLEDLMKEEGGVLLR